ncbi:hypothetical protein HLRTI_000408 [Halorhabdus tiamatea SARL4B]|uniref:Uncharacterized protein n=1 Tax=Halorhabdus tiamatea SARL4B TaxID=1033806 RepID=F7PME9_9EURY|nr:hypothetical protein HLRTI_000408 [Halorhabdus tiamatea SARL4B]
MSTKSESDQNSIERTIQSYSLKLAVTLSAYLLVVGNAAAASSPSATDLSICDVEFLGPAINALFSIAVTGALVLGILTWVLTSFTESLPLPQSTKQTIQKQRNGAIASMLRTAVVPALILAILSVLSIGIPSCITILPT